MWKKLSCSFAELNLDITLGGGQSFRWSKSVEGEWLGAIYGHICSLKRDTNGNLLYQFHTPIKNTLQNDKELPPAKRQRKAKSKVQNTVPLKKEESPLKYHENILKEYFNLNFPLVENYDSWSELDENFKKVSQKYKGIRILRQDPVENLFSFICSTNNNIPRITSMVEKLCLNYGEKIGDVNGQEFHDFPKIDRLAKPDVEQELRQMGFGYRAKYIHQTAKVLQNEKPEGWLQNLRKVTYKEAHNALISLPGVGAKVADCVCLMSLDKYEAIPIDTHIWQVTVKDYIPKFKAAKTLTGQIYQEVGDFYRERFGDCAGWANTVLFASDLKMFKDSK
ncbi:hypothetical protein JTE90_027786 [Oedothorax gibbosus]|uniref:N-glycosylase/DNA lyase n=1 Tax=Oedothorax gibbosus TaxID=931172 RepID=A0AAV6V7U9_9ARAC|nr:hypothetical protein JTE90_027786 [Oedothorax gibbosus]